MSKLPFVSRKAVLVLVFAALGLCFADSSQAGHGSSSKGSSKLFGSEFECIYEVGDVTIELSPILGITDPAVGQITQTQEPGTSVTCTLTASEPVSGEFIVDLTAKPVTIGDCMSNPSENSSQRTLTMFCGDEEEVFEELYEEVSIIKADITGSFTASDPSNNQLCINAEQTVDCAVNVGGANVLEVPMPEYVGTSLTCNAVFPGPPAGQMLSLEQFFPNHPNCGETVVEVQAAGTKVAVPEKGHTPEYTLRIAMATSMFDGHAVLINSLRQMLPAASTKESPSGGDPPVGEIVTAQSVPPVHVDDGPLNQSMCHAGSDEEEDGFTFDPGDPGVCIAAINNQPPGGSTLLTFTMLQMDLDPNFINTKKCPSKKVITAVVFGQTEPQVFDVRQIDFTTVMLGDGVPPDEPVATHKDGRFRVSFGDDNFDGNEDAILKFLRCNGIIEQLRGGDTTLILEGQTLGGSNLHAEDDVVTRP